MKYTKSAIGLLTSQYRSVLKKCLLINLGLYALGVVAATPAMATEVSNWGELQTALTDGTTDISVTGNITATEGDGFYVSGSKNIALNGNTINGNNIQKQISIRDGADQTVTITGGGTISNLSYTVGDYQDSQASPIFVAVKANLALEDGDYTFKDNASRFGIINLNNNFTDGTTSLTTSNVGTLTFQNNTSTDQGGALYITGSGGKPTEASLVATNKIVFDNNSVTDASKTGHGGAIMNMGTNTTISANEVEFTNNKVLAVQDELLTDVVKSGGGAIQNAYDGVMTIGKAGGTVLFDENSSTTNGGAIAARGAAATTINGSSVTFSNNQAALNGGAIYSTSTGAQTISNATFTDNTAGGLGGAIYNTGTTNINGSATFSGNTDSTGANDIYNTGTLNLNATTVNDSIVLNGGIDGDSENKGTTNITGAGTVEAASIKNQDVTVSAGELAIATTATDGSNLSGSTVTVNSGAIINTIDDVINNYTGKITLNNGALIKGDINFTEGAADTYTAVGTVKYKVGNLIGAASSGTKEIQVASNGSTIDISEAIFNSENGMSFASSGSADGKIKVVGMAGGIEEAADASGNVSEITYNSTTDETLSTDKEIKNTFTLNGGNKELELAGANLGVADGANVTINNLNLEGTGTLNNAASGILRINDSNVNVKVRNAGILYSDPTTYDDTLTNTGIANINGDTFSAKGILENYNIANLTSVTFDSGAQITGSGTTNLVSGTTAFNNTANSNVVKVASGANFSGALNGGTLDLHNSAIDNISGSLASGNAIIDAKFAATSTATNSQIDTLGANAGTIKEINILGTAYGDADEVKLAVGDATLDGNVQINGMNYYTKVEKDASGNLVFSDKLINTSTIRGTGDGSTTFVGDVVIGDKAATTTVGTTNAKLALNNTNQTAEIVSGVEGNGAHVAVDTKTKKKAELSADETTGGALYTAGVNANATDKQVEMSAEYYVDATDTTSPTKNAYVRANANSTQAKVTVAATDGLDITTGANTSTLTATATGLNVDDAYTVGTHGTTLGDGSLVLNADGSHPATLTSTANGLNVAEGFTVATNKFTVDNSGNTAVAGTLTANGNVTLGDAAVDTITVNGTATFTPQINATNGIKAGSNTSLVDGTLTVSDGTDTSTLTKNTLTTTTVKAGANTTLTNGSLALGDGTNTATLTSTANGLNVAQGLTVATDKFTVDNSGNTAVAGTLGVTGVTTAEGGVIFGDTDTTPMTSVGRTEVAAKANAAANNSVVASTAAIQATRLASEASSNTVLGGIYKIDGTEKTVSYDNTAIAGTNGFESGATSLTDALTKYADNVKAATGTTFAANGTATNVYTAQTVGDDIASTDSFVTAISKINTNLENVLTTAGTEVDSAKVDVQWGTSSPDKTLATVLGSGTYTNGAAVNYGAITEGASLTTAISQVASNIGGTIASVQTRTVGAIAAGNTVNANISALDTAIGANVGSSNYVAATNSVNANISALDAGVGAKIASDGNIIKASATNSVNANISALDSSIGALASLSTSNNLVQYNAGTGAGTVAQNLTELDRILGKKQTAAATGGILEGKIIGGNTGTTNDISVIDALDKVATEAVGTAANNVFTGANTFRNNNGITIQDGTPTYTTRLTATADGLNVDTGVKATGFKLGSNAVTSIDIDGSAVNNTTAAKSVMATGATIYEGAENAKYDGTKINGDTSSTTIKTALDKTNTSLNSILTSDGTEVLSTKVDADWNSGNTTLSNVLGNGVYSSTDQVTAGANLTTAIGQLDDAIGTTVYANNSAVNYGTIAANTDLTQAVSQVASNIGSAAVSGANGNVLATNTVNANLDAIDVKLGNLSTLTTTANTNVVSAINELVGDITVASNGNYIVAGADVKTNLGNLDTKVKTNADAIKGLNDDVIGDMAALQTAVADANSAIFKRGNLTNGATTPLTSFTIANAFTNIDLTMGQIHGLRTKLEGGSGTTATSAGSNLATGTTVEDHLTALDASIGNRTAIASANTAINTATATSVASGLKAAGDAIGTQTYVNNAAVNYSAIAANTDLTTAVSQVASNIGSAVTSTNYAAAANTVNANISAIDSALGTKIATDGNFIKDSDENSINENISALDTAIGDMSGFATNNIAKTTTNVAANITALDSAIGANVTGTNYIAATNTVNQNLDALDTGLKSLSDTAAKLADNNVFTGHNTFKSNDGITITNGTGGNPTQLTATADGLNVSTGVKVNGNEIVTGNAAVQGKLTLGNGAGNTTDLTSTATGLEISNDTTIDGDLEVTGDLVAGDATLDSLKFADTQTVSAIDNGATAKTATSANNDTTMATVATVLKSAQNAEFTSTGPNVTTAGATLGSAINELDNAIGDRSNIASANTAINTATATSVAAGLKAVGDAIGTADFSATKNASAATNLTTAVTSLDTAIGDMSDFATNNTYAKSTTVAQNLTSLDGALKTTNDVIGTGATLADTATSAGNLAGKVIGDGSAGTVKVSDALTTLNATNMNQNTTLQGLGSVVDGSVIDAATGKVTTAGTALSTDFSDNNLTSAANELLTDITVAAGTYNNIAAGANVATNLINLDASIGGQIDSNGGLLDNIVLGNGSGEQTVAGAFGTIGEVIGAVQTTAATSGILNGKKIGNTINVIDAIDTIATSAASLAGNNVFTGHNTFKNDAGITIQNGTGTFTTQLTATADGLDISGGMKVNGNTTITGNETVEGNLTIGTGTDAVKLSADDNTLSTNNGSINAGTGSVTAATFKAGTYTTLTDGTLTVADATNTSTLTSTALTTTTVNATDVNATNVTATGGVTIGSGTGATTLTSDANGLKINNDTIVDGELTVNDVANFKDDVTVDGDTDLKGKLDVAGATNLKGKLDVTGAATFDSTVTANGLITANNGLTVATGKDFTLGGTAVNTIDTDGTAVSAATTSAKALATGSTVYLGAENAKFTSTVTSGSNITTATIKGALNDLDTSIGDRSSMKVGTDVSYTTAALKDKDIATAITQVASNIGSAVTGTNDNVLATNSVNANLDRIDTKIGDIRTFKDSTTGNLSNSSTPSATTNAQDVATAINNIDKTLGQIHGLKAKLQAIDTDKGTNLAAGTTVEDHLTSLDSAIGNRAITSANTDINTATATSISAGLKTVGDKIGTMDFASARYISGENNLTGAVNTLDSNLSRVENKVDSVAHDLRDLRHDFKSGMASMSAMTALVPNPRAYGDTSLSVGTGAYDGHTAVALGGFHYLTDNIMLNAGAAWGNTNDVAYRMGVTWSW